MNSNKQTPVQNKSGPCPKSAKAIQMKPKRLYGGKDSWNRWVFTFNHEWNLREW